MPATHDVPSPTAPDQAGVAFHPPLLLAGSLLAGFLFGRIFPLDTVPQWVSVPLGPTVVTASFGLFIWAVVTMRGAGGSIPTSEPTDAIVTHGPYRFSRNPIYVAMLAFQVGTGIWTGNAWYLLWAAFCAGSPRVAATVNGSMPAPTLRWCESDTVTL